MTSISHQHIWWLQSRPFTEELEEELEKSVFTPEFLFVSFKLQVYSFAKLCDHLLQYIQSSSSLRFCASCEAKDFKQYSQHKGFLLLRHHYVSFSNIESLCSIYVSICSVQETTDTPALIKHAQRISENKEKHILKVCCPIRNRAKTFEQHINLLTVSYSTSWQELSQLRIPLKTTHHGQSSEVSALVRQCISQDS